MPATTQDIVNVMQDPLFRTMNEKAQIEVLSHIDPNYSALPDQSKRDVLYHFSPPKKPERGKGTIGETPREVVRSVGGMVGGAVGFASPIPGGTIAGAGLGGGGADALYQIGQHIFGDPNAPKTSLEAAKQIGIGGGREAAFEAVGVGAGKVIGKVLMPFAKKVMPEAMETITKLKSKIKPVLLPSEATESRFLDVLQNISEGSILGGGSLAKFKLQRQMVLEDWADDIINMMGKRTSPEEMGEFFVHTIEGKQKAFKSVAGILYNNVEELAEGSVIKSNTLKQFAKEAGLSGERLGGIEAVNAGDDLIKAVSDLPDELTFAEAKELKTRLMSKVDEFSILNKKAPAVGKAKKLIELTDNGIEKGLNKEALEAWRNANAFYKEGQDRFNNVMIRRLLKHAEETGLGPEMIGKNIFKPGNITLIRKVKSALNPDQFERLKNFYIQDLFKKSLDMNAEISGKKLLNNMFYKPTGMGEQTLKEIFSPDQLTEIKKFGNALKLMQEKQGEGLGRMWIQLAQGSAVVGLGAGIAYDQDTLKGSSALILFGPAILSKMMLKPSITRYLTKGIMIPKNSPQVLGILSRLIDFANRTKLTEEE